MIDKMVQVIAEESELMAVLLVISLALNALNFLFITLTDNTLKRLYKQLRTRGINVWEGGK